MSHLLTDQLRLMADAFESETAYKNVATGATLTFGDWEGRSNRLARGLVGAGVRHGDRVVVHVAPDDVLDWIVAYAAVHKAGAVAVPTNTRMVGRELGDVLAHAGPVAALVSPSLQLVIDEARASSTDLRIVASAPWLELLDHDASTFQAPIADHDIADLMYTSGTTGRSKAVVVRHDNAAMMPNGLPQWSGGGWLHGSPMSTFAGISSVYNPMKLGLTGLFLPHFDPERWLEVVNEERPVAVFLVPAMAQLIVTAPSFATADLSSIVICSLGSAPLPIEVQRRLQARLPNATANNSYGMTEAGPAYCTLPKEEVGRRVGSVGRPMPPVEFAIVDEDGDPSCPLPPGEVGELIIRNPGRQREYYRDPDATAEAWRDGWLYSGDLGYLDEDGYLYIVGRKKDVIIRGGNNVHALDVEQVLYEHPAVLEVAVAGVAHDVLGEDVGAWVVLRPGAMVAEAELQQFCRERLADFKVPRHVMFVAALPRNATGKVVKSQLEPMRP